MPTDPEKQALEELARRVETEKPSRELDCLIAKVRGAEQAYVTSLSGRAQMHRDGMIFSVPAYTTSVDAALSLLPAVLSFDLSKDHQYHGGKWQCLVGPESEWHVTGRASAETPAQAITAAALRAHAKQETTDAG